jgi:glycosyltransferase involved in cell wall biosynthesis
MPSFHVHADALLVSLKDEPIFSMTIPGKIQAYLAAGIPILAMLNGEGAAVIIDSGAGLSIPAGDGGALARAVHSLMKMSKGELLEMAARGPIYSKKEFDRMNLISKVLVWFDQIVFENQLNLSK